MLCSRKLSKGDPGPGAGRLSESRLSKSVYESWLGGQLPYEKVHEQVRRLRAHTHSATYPNAARASQSVRNRVMRTARWCIWYLESRAGEACGAYAIVLRGAYAIAGSAPARATAAAADYPPPCA